jgi:hypothetical protein
VREVRTELTSRSDSDVVDQWARKHQSVFLSPSTAEMQFVQQIFSIPHFQALVGNQAMLQGNPVADPFVIASAKIKNGCVVTEEKFKPNAAKIPNVCEHFEIPCINLEEFMNQEDWSF